MQSNFLTMYNCTLHLFNFTQHLCHLNIDVNKYTIYIYIIHIFRRCSCTRSWAWWSHASTQPSNSAKLQYLPVIAVRSIFKVYINAVIAVFAISLKLRALIEIYAILHVYLYLSPAFNQEQRARATDEFSKQFYKNLNNFLVS